ncbi:relaxase/mobilization nuclease domain-containing protein [Planotetraspora silvatica]|uniref:relaxase/mobilization nuclease domain-containing protein n=1 Tax=Planotetraspora silvatica TaxID=234614 RepID=UPI00357134EF
MSVGACITSDRPGRLQSAFSGLTSTRKPLAIPQGRGSSHRARVRVSAGCGSSRGRHLRIGWRRDEPVWHCVARTARDDRVLDDDEWARVAHEIMNRTGLAADGDDDAVRWVAVRHADDHIHIVATLARQDGTKPKTWNDFYRVREACQAVELHYGLKVTAPGDRTAARRPTRSETEHARQRRWAEVPRITLRRHVNCRTNPRAPAPCDLQKNP